MLVGGMRDWLNYVVLQDEDLPETTLRIVTTCIVSRGFHEEHRPRWQWRQTFAIGTWCYYALLGAPSNQPLVNFLAQHKGPKGIGNKYLDSVTLFWPDTIGTHPLIWKPVQIWEVKNTDLDGECAEAVKDFWGEEWKHENDFIRTYTLPVPPLADDSLPVIYGKSASAELEDSSSKRPHDEIS